MSYQDLKECKIITAFITPFHEDGSINFDAIPALIEHLLSHHTDGILLAGTTAESPTLTHDEELELFAAVQKIVNGRVPLIAGVGTNDTRDSIEFVKEVAEFGGFAAGLAIVPYYNKPSQEGMYQHFKAIADASDLPIIIYNIPGRVVVELTPETMLRLADHPNIIGVKECTSLANMAYLIEHKPEEFLVYTGEDGDAFHAMNLGADGVISVASHTNGDEMHEMFTAIAESDMKKVSIKTAFKNKNFVVYLKFASVWLFTWEFLKPMTEYYRIKVLGVNTMFISQMGVLTAILSSILYLVYGKLSDKYGNKTMLRMGIFFTTYYVLTYFSMTQDNKMSMLFAAAVIDAIGFTAITLSLLNLMMEVSGEPADAYVGAYAMVSGLSAIFAFVIGFILRLFSLLELTRVYSFEKTFVYPGGSSRIKSMFSKIMFSGSRYVIHSNKGKNEDSDEQNVDKEENVNGKSNESKIEL